MMYMKAQTRVEQLSCVLPGPAVVSVSHVLSENNQHNIPPDWPTVMGRLRYPVVMETRKVEFASKSN